MAQLGQAQTGSLRSTPKQLKIRAADNSAVVFKNMGNNHNVPFIWSASATMENGESEVVLASGVKFYDMDLASYANTVVTPTSDPGGYYYVTNDTDANVIKLYASTAVTTSGVVYNVQFMLGNAVDVSTLNTRGTGAPAQSYP
jgi:hypothetical protein